MSESPLPCVVCKVLPCKVLYCSQCKDRRFAYCSKECQKIDWKRGHKKECKPWTDPASDSAQARALAAQVSTVTNALAAARLAKPSRVKRIPMREFVPGEERVSRPSSASEMFVGDGFVSGTIWFPKEQSGLGRRRFYIKKSSRIESSICNALIKQCLGGQGQHIRLMTDEEVYIDDTAPPDMAALDSLQMKWRPFAVGKKVFYIYYISKDDSVRARGSESGASFTADWCHALRSVLDDDCECFITVPGTFVVEEDANGDDVYTVPCESVDVPFAPNGGPPPPEYLQLQPPTEEMLIKVLKRAAQEMLPCTFVTLVTGAHMHSFLTLQAEKQRQSEQYVKVAQVVFMIQEHGNARDLVFVDPYGRIQFNQGAARSSEYACDQVAAHNVCFPWFNRRLFYIFLFKSLGAVTAGSEDLTSILAGLGKIAHMKEKVDTCVIVGADFWRELPLPVHKAISTQYGFVEVCPSTDVPADHMQLPPPSPRHVVDFLKAVLDRMSSPIYKQLMPHKNFIPCTLATVLTEHGIGAFAVPAQEHVWDCIMRELISIFCEDPRRLQHILWMDGEYTCNGALPEDISHGLRSVSVNDSAGSAADVYKAQVKIDDTSVFVYGIHHPEAPPAKDASVQGIFSAASALIGAEKRICMLVIIGAQHVIRVGPYDGTEHFRTVPVEIHVPLPVYGKRVAGVHETEQAQRSQPPWYMFVPSPTHKQIWKFLGGASSQQCLWCGCVKLDLKGHALKCARCRNAVYCSKQCQNSHWKQHKRVCGKGGLGSDGAAGGAARGASRGAARGASGGDADDAGVDLRE